MRRLETRGPIRVSAAASKDAPDVEDVPDAGDGDTKIDQERTRSLDNVPSKSATLGKGVNLVGNYR